MPDAVTATTLEGEALRFMTAVPPRFGTLATINADGTPHQAVVWYEVRDGVVVLNSLVGRVWPTNLQRDPRCSLAVEDGYRWVAVRGSVEVVDDPAVAMEDICGMARRYHKPREAARVEATFRSQQRISFLLRPRSVSIHL